MASDQPENKDVGWYVVTDQLWLPTSFEPEDFHKAMVRQFFGWEWIAKQDLLDLIDE